MERLKAVTHIPMAFYASGLAFSGKKNCKLSWYWAMLTSGIKIKKEEGSFCSDYKCQMPPHACSLQTFAFKTSSVENALASIRSPRSDPLHWPALTKTISLIDYRESLGPGCFINFHREHFPTLKTSTAKIAMGIPEGHRVDFRPAEDKPTTTEDISGLVLIFRKPLLL